MRESTQIPEIRVDTQVKTVTVGDWTKWFEVLLWVLGILPGVIFLMCRISAENYFSALEQKIQVLASEIDNYLEQRVVVMKNLARLLDRAIDLDKSTYESLARLKYSGGMRDSDRNQLSAELDAGWNQIHMLVEDTPELRAHEAIQQAISQNMELQRQITAARTVYNDAVYAWNRDIYQYIVKRVVAAKHQYTTRVPFVASKEIKQQATQVFF